MAHQGSFGELWKCLTEECKIHDSEDEIPCCGPCHMAKIKRKQMSLTNHALLRKLCFDSQHILTDLLKSHLPVKVKESLRDVKGNLLDIQEILGIYALIGVDTDTIDEIQSESKEVK